MATTEHDTEERPGARVPRHRLLEWTAGMFRRMGVADDAADLAAETLVVADTRGVESHGVARLPVYHARIKAGLIDLDAPLTVEREGAATIAFDAHHGLGLAQAPLAMARTVEKAKDAGLCMATVRHGNHFGIAGVYALMAAREGLGGMAMTNATPLVVPTYGATGMLGTNPIAFAVPTGPQGTPPLVIDLASSTVAWGKIEIARRSRKAIPLGWALDEAGEPTTDPHAARWLTPLGGDRDHGGQKGYSLGLIVDTLCGPLAGAAWGQHISAFRGTEALADLGFWFLAWRIDAFRDPEAFHADVTTMLDELRGMPAAPDAPHGVLSPGDPELAKEREARERGIFLTAPVLAELDALAADLKVPFDLL